MADLLFGIWKSVFALIYPFDNESQIKANWIGFVIIFVTPVLLSSVAVILQCVIKIFSCCEITVPWNELLSNMVLIIASALYFFGDNVADFSNSHRFAVVSPYLLLTAFFIFQYYIDFEKKMGQCLECCEEEPCCGISCCNKCCKEYSEVQSEAESTDEGSAEITIEEKEVIDSLFNAFSSISFFIVADAVFTAIGKPLFSKNSLDIECGSADGSLKIRLAWFAFAVNLFVYFLYFLEWKKCSTCDIVCKVNYSKLVLLLPLVSAFIMYLIADNSELIRCSRKFLVAFTNENKVKLILYILTFVIVSPCAITCFVLNAMKHNCFPEFRKNALKKLKKLCCISNEDSAEKNLNAELDKLNSVYYAYDDLLKSRRKKKFTCFCSSKKKSN